MNKRILKSRLGSLIRLRRFHVPAHVQKKFVVFSRLYGFRRYQVEVPVVLYIPLTCVLNVVSQYVASPNNALLLA